MSSWKQYPQLFANGKFKFIDHLGEEETLKGVIVYDYGTWLLNGNGEEISDVEYCKLIARPISDMSDEEKSIHKHRKRWEYDDSRDLSTYYESSKSFIYLISIGVLPETFDDTGVIWRYENE